MAAYGLDKPALISLKNTEVDIDAENSDGNTAMGVSLQYSQTEVVQTLIDYTMSMDYNHCEDAEIPQSLGISTRHSRISIISPKPSRTNRMTILGYVASIGTRQMMEYLIPRLNKEINQPSSLEEYTPLMLAIRRGADDIVDFLLTVEDLDVNAQDLWERTALAIAIRSYRYPAVKMLLRHPWIEVNCQDKDKRTPLHEAVSQRNTAILEMLLRHPKLDPSVGDVARLDRLVSQSDDRIKRLMSSLTSRVVSD
ncbi:ankyrin repeat-containing domain protein [Nemania sp. FL0031]|nr:ankyrin repeat-containing domain protein [Nemania sp. FL0031]